MSTLTLVILLPVKIEQMLKTYVAVYGTILSDFFPE
jgi:hypothetical protein